MPTAAPPPPPTLTAIPAGESLPRTREAWRNLPPFVATLLDALPDPFFVKDTEGCFLYINRAGGALLGRTPADIMGRRTHEVMPESRAERISSHEREALLGDTPVEWEESVCAGENSRVMLVTVTPLKEDTGHIRGLVGTARDITERVLREASLTEDAARLRRLAESSLLGVLIACMDGTILEANAAALYLLGRARTDIESGQVSWSDLVEPSARLAHDRALYQLRETGTALPWETVYLQPDGKSVPLICGAVLLEGHRCLIYLIDSEERQQAQDRQVANLQNEQAARAEAEAAVNRLEGILTITDTALARLDSHDFLDELLARICSVLQADAATLWLMDDDGKHLHVTASHGLETEFGYEQRALVGQGFVGGVAATREPVVVEDLTRHAAGNLFLREQIRALLGVPLMVHGRVIGVLHVGSVQPRPFPPEAVHLLQLVADRAAMAIERARLFEEVRVSKEQLDALSRRLLDVQENERRHIARELHDQIGQALTAVKITLQSVARSLPEETSPIQEAVSTVEEAITQVRGLSRDLRPPVLDDLGLVAALRWFANRQTNTGAFQCLVDAGSPAYRMPEHIEIACFRVAQEAVTNAGRHARATTVTIQLQVKGEQLHLLVEDDGDGFDVAVARERTSRGECLGLLNMEERVRLAGGRFWIKSRIGGGTQIRSTFPLPPQNHAGKGRSLG